MTSRIQSIDGTPYRIVTVSPGQGRGALMVARDWSENAAVLRQLATVLSVLAAALAVVAAVIGWLVARRITGPLIRLTQTAEQISIDSDRDRWFTANEAKEYGLIDNVIIGKGELA